MVTRFPHLISYLLSNQNAVKDENNRWVTPAASMVEYACRIERNAQNEVIEGASGEMVVYKNIAYLDKGANEIPVGTTVNLKDRFGKVFSTNSKVVNFERNQLNTRVYLS